MSYYGVLSVGEYRQLGKAILNHINYFMSLRLFYSKKKPISYAYLILLGYKRRCLEFVVCTEFSIRLP